MDLDDDELIYTIALTRVPNVGAIIARNLISHTGSASAVFKQPKGKLLKIDGIGLKTLEGLHDVDALRVAEKEIKFLQKHQIQAHFYTDESYPKRLKPHADSPILLYTRGDIDLNAPKMVSVVGTRSSTTYGADFCRELAQAFAPFGLTIVSGLALGIDTYAHREALAAGLPTIGVLGHGLSSIYPPENKALAAKMLENGGLVTEYVSITKPKREHFPQRNRIIAALCDALVVVEAASKGGALITAEIANDYNKDVYALPGKTTDKYSEGCNRLIKMNKAGLITEANDIVKTLGWKTKEGTPQVQRTLFVELTQEERLVHQLIENEVGLDDLLIQCNLPHSHVAGVLLSLEFKGVVQQMPGKRFRIIG